MLGRKVGKSRVKSQIHNRFKKTSAFKSSGGKKSTAKKGFVVKFRGFSCC